MLYTNGYIVKDLVANEEFLVNNPMYRGLQNYHNWPLIDEKDKISNDLTNLIENHFSNNNNVEILNNTNLLSVYVNHCKEVGIEIIVQKIRTSNNSIIADKDLTDVEVLGYDCIAGDSISYLAEIFMNGADKIELYKKTINNVNSNGLFNTYKEAVDFIFERNKLIEKGVNLEDYWEAIPAKISLVHI